MFRNQLYLPLLVMLMSGVVANIGRAEDGAGFSSQYLPDDAIAAVFVPVESILSDPGMEMFPIEIVQAQLKENVGIDPLHISKVKLVVGFPGPAGPQFGAVIELSQDYDIGDLNEKLLRSTEPQEIEGLSVFPFDGPPGTVLYRKDARTWIVAMGGYLKQVVDANGEAGPLPKLVSSLQPQKGVTAVAVLQSIRPMVSGILRQNADQMPQEIRELTEVAELTDALILNVDYQLGGGKVSLAAMARDDAAATELDRILNDAIDYGRDTVMNLVSAQSSGGTEVDKATAKYAARIAAKVTESLRPQKSGHRVSVQLESNFATTGVLVGLLLPAVQAAREAARRMSASNGMKQIALAMHNHHAAFGSLPDRAIRDADGKPLLSWRVKLLPFIDEQGLYSQFHLDEPWDSEHNLKLLPLMPQNYVDPSVPAEPGYTVFQLPVGAETLFPEQGERKFRDVLDGLSNTIMAVETNRSLAVPWTKPADIEIDINNPLPQLGNTHPGGFHVLMADGVVRFVTTDIVPETLKALFTYQGNEVVQF
ncbi:hypothetical protein Pla52o_20060 [Novipirellula galeiformis]|uniref:DUF1559 domain-containing protein n=1 Tax=Novipirellula galeiformis TaxID=2528004 RepID=A0A5C6CGQ2_9BACT|nr:DUF1559 domain-containing protein [Novipirellula galeiformis]TWU24083.1 hypothetical protein Pla52o_20060 [Novipirellula galeiformis]